MSDFKLICFSYIQLLKDENQKQVSSASDVPRVAESADDKKVSQLERTVFILKRVVEKLQVENKRLVSGKRPLSERSVCYSIFRYRTVVL